MHRLGWNTRFEFLKFWRGYAQVGVEHTLLPEKGVFHPHLCITAPEFLSPPEISG